MNKEFVLNPEALELKQLGFDEPCLATIDQTDFIHIKSTEYPIRGAMVYDTIDCPTYSQAFRWFREKHGICGWIQESYFKGRKFYQYHISRVSTLNVISDLFECDYEEAELACLKKLIEIVKK